MTVWRKGMLAVCRATLPWVDDGNNLVSGPSGGEVCQVVGLKTDDLGGLMLDLAEWPHPEGYAASSFRPAVLDWQTETQTRTSKLDDMLKGRIPA